MAGRLIAFVPSVPQIPSVPCVEGLIALCVLATKQLIVSFMSEHEFEQFLAIFRGMLRLNPAQRDEIAAELMDHLQERLAELSARGMSREKAVQSALEEFGDAAGLAAQFVLIVSQQRRRRIMKWTAGSVMVAMIILYGAYAFWPAQPVRGPGFTPLVAQEKAPPADAKKAKKKEAPPTKAPIAASPKNDATQEVESHLAEKMPANFAEVTLQDFLDAVGEQAKVDFYVDRPALDEAGIPKDAMISINLKSIRIDKLLDVVLAQHSLSWLTRDGYVFITTKDKLEQTLETRVYNCRDLVELALFGTGMQSRTGEGGMEGSMGGSGSFGGMAGSAGMASGAAMPGMGGMPGGGGMMPGGMMPGGMMPSGMGGLGMGGMAPGGMEGMASGAMGGVPMGMGGGMGPTDASMLPFMGTLIQVITTTVMPESWTSSGGSGSVAAYHNGLLVVNHHPNAHRKIEQLLRMLRDASKDRPGTVVRER